MDNAFAYKKPNDEISNLYNFTSKSKTIDKRIHALNLGNTSDYKYKKAKISSDNKIYHDEYDNRKNIINEGDNMDNDKILEIYISKVDKEQSELRQDIREIEKRLESHIVASEQRMDEKLSRIENMISSQNSQIEKINDKIDKVKDDIHKNTIEQYRFWIGLAISIVIGVAGIIVTLIK